MAKKYSYAMCEAMLFDALEDDQAGIDWWNSCSEADRAFWLRAALTAVPAQAWKHYKGCKGHLPTEGLNGQV